MKVKYHYSGIAISYQEKGSSSKGLNPSPIVSKSKSNRDKRKIKDMLYWLWRNSVHRPLIGVNTLPVPLGGAITEKLVSENLSRFWENLRKNYDLKNYVWIREYQSNGRPHFHWVADSRYMDAVRISRYWSGLFSAVGDNSIRLGTNPARPPRKFFLDSPAMAGYLAKYIGKAFGPGETARNVKAFNHSKEVELKSRPVVYDAVYSREFESEEVFGKTYEKLASVSRVFTLCENSERELLEIYGQVPEHLKSFDDQKFSWICPNPIHRVYYGIPKRKR